MPILPLWMKSENRVSAAGKGLANWGYNDVYAEALIEMLQEVSRAFPTVTFFAIPGPCGLRFRTRQG